MQGHLDAALRSSSAAGEDPDVLRRVDVRMPPTSELAGSTLATVQSSTPTCSPGATCAGLPASRTAAAAHKLSGCALRRMPCLLHSAHVSSHGHLLIADKFGKDNMERGWEVFSLQYHVDGPLGAVLSPDAMAGE